MPRAYAAPDAPSSTHGVTQVPGRVCWVSSLRNNVEATRRVREDVAVTV